MTFKISEKANNNYLAKIVKLENIQKVENSDNLYKVFVDFQPIVINNSLKEGDICVYFATDCQINSEFLSFTNSFRDSSLNADKEKKAYFENNCKTRTIKLRGENSCGCLFPLKEMNNFLESKGKETIDYKLDTYFDYFDDIEICKKYVVKGKQSNFSGTKKEKKSKVSKIVEDQFRFSVDVDNFRKNIHKISPDTIISVSKKVHGTNAVFSHVLIKKELTRVENFILSLEKYKFLEKFIPNIKKEEYGYIFSSRKVVKSVESEEVEDKQHFYDFDLWSYVGEEGVKGKLPKGYTVYGEICGFVPNTKSFIQKGYDYGCVEGEYKLLIFRVTFTSSEGKVFDLNTLQANEFCERVGLKFVEIYYYGKAKDMFPEINVECHWNEEFLNKLENVYLEGYDKECKSSSKIPFEGIVIKKEESPFNGGNDIWKLKSFLFLKRESEELDKGEENIEDEN